MRTHDEILAETSVSPCFDANLLNLQICWQFGLVLVNILKFSICPSSANTNKPPESVTMRPGLLNEMTCYFSTSIDDLHDNERLMNRERMCNAFLKWIPAVR